MPVYNLPAIEYDPMPAPGGYGQWERATDLRGLAKSLRIANAKHRIDDIKSIPDAWAQVQVGSQALLDHSHELHADAMSQWRGLLTLFALQPFFQEDYELELKWIPIADNAGAGRRLRKVLHQLAPTVQLAPTLRWSPTGVVLLHQHRGGPRGAVTIPIGVLSPWTLVAPGKLASGLLHPTVPWMAKGLVDPTDLAQSEGLSSDQFNVLAAYLRQLQRALANTGARTADHDLFASLVAELHAFQEAAEARITDQTGLVGYQVPLDCDGFFANLGSTFTVDPAAVAEDSLCKLRVRPEMMDLFQGVILVDPAFERTLGRTPESIRVWERTTLRDASSPAVLARVKSDALARGYLVIEPADLFTTKLIKFGAEASIQGHPQSFRNALLPLSPLALMLLDRQTLSTSITLIERAGGHEVSLRLPLEFDQRRAALTQHTTTRTFTNSDVVREERPNDLALWPNFETPEWRWNYFRFQYNPIYEHLHPRFAISADFVKSDILMRNVGPIDRGADMMAWSSNLTLGPDLRLKAGRISELRDNAGSIIVQRLRFADKPEVVGEVHRLSRAAEAIFFSLGDEGSVPDTPVGCVLIKSNSPAHAQNQAHVAIDFGTTNTIANWLDRGTFRTVQFHDRIVFPISSTINEAAQRNGLMAPFVDFMPLHDRSTPIPTVVKKREFDPAIPGFTGTEAGGDDRHGFSDCIFFVPGYDNMSIPGILKIARHLEFNIKWTPEGPKRQLIKRFLRQMIMMTAAELTADGISPANVSWLFSYPQAFTPRERISFTAFTQLAWQDLFGDVKGGAQRPIQQIIKLETEGAAALRDFTQDKEHALAGGGDLMIMLDIGGGTTDIAVAYRQQIRWRSSVKIAGGDFFTQYLVNNFDLLKQMNFGAVAEFSAGMAEANNQEIKNFVELFVNDPNFSTNFRSFWHAVSAEPAGAGLRQCASVALGGLMHYMGDVLKIIMSTSSDDRPTPEDLRNLTVAFGGRGSTFFQLLDDKDPKSELKRLCGLVIASAGYDPGDVQITTRFSPRTKHEVVRGMLRAVLNPPAGALDDDELWPAAPLGDDVKVRKGGRDVVLESDESIPDLMDCEGLAGVTLVGLKAFLAGLRRQVGLSIDLSGRNGEATAGSAEQVIAQNAKTALRTILERLDEDERHTREDQFVPPPFISELKILIELMNGPISARSNKLLVIDHGA